MADAEIQSFDFKRHWAKKVKPFLSDEKVQQALNDGMNAFTQNRVEQHLQRGFYKTEAEIREKIPHIFWQSGDAPYTKTISDYWCTHRKPREGSFGWYQVFGACHWIAPFCMALGRKIYPEFEWRVISGEKHSAAVGFMDNSPRIVFDILMFETMSAKEIIEFATA